MDKRKLMIANMDILANVRKCVYKEIGFNFNFFDQKFDKK